MTLDSKVPGGPIEGKWDRHKFESKLVNPANRRKLTVLCVGHGAGRRLGVGGARRAGLQRHHLLHPRQPAPRALDCRAGRHQRRQELPQRRRQHLPAVLRHGQGRRLPRPRGQRLPPRAGQRRHHRPVRGAGRALRARVRRPARQPLVRRRAGVAHVLRARPDGPAAADRRLSVDDAAGGRRHRHADAAARDARRRARGRPGPRHHHPQPRHRRTREVGRRCRAALHRRLRHGVLPVHQRGEQQRHGGVARPQARRPVRQSLLHPDPPDLHPRLRRPPEQADAHEREPAQRRARLGAEAARATSVRRSRFPTPSATTTSSAGIPASATWCRATSRRGPPSWCATTAAASARRAWRSTWTSPTPSTGSARTSSRERYGNLFDMYQKITDDNPYEVPMRIFPAVHYTMGGLWVDYNLMSTIPGLHVLGEANFSDHGANRLGASALMQGLADGYFVIPYTLEPLPRQHGAAESHHRPRRVRRSRRQRAGADHAPAVGQGQQDASRTAPPARTRRVGLRRHVAHRRRPEEGPDRDPAAARGVLAERLGARASRTT